MGRLLFNKTIPVLKKVILLMLLICITATQLTAQTYCTPSSSYNNYYINNFSTTLAVTNISNLNSGYSTAGYGDYTGSQSITSAVGGSFDFSGSFNNGSFGVKIWVDWNVDGDFDDPDEEMFNTNSYITSFTGTIDVPATAVAGITRLRVGADYYNSSGPAPCGSISYGEFEDYGVILAPFDNAAAGSLITPTTTPYCSNSSKQVSVSIINRGSNAINNVMVNWSLDNVIQTPVNVSTPITTYGDSLIVVLGNVFFPTTAQMDLKYWTSAPNGVDDSEHSDDSASAVIGALLAGVEVHISPQDTTICEGTSITLHAGIFPNDPIYIWNNGSLDSTRTVSNTGTYSVKVQNDMGCFDYDTVSVSVYPNPQVNSIAIIADGSTITFNVILPQNVTSYTWDFDDGTMPQDVTGTPGQEIHDYTAPGEYTVTLTVRNQCGEVTVTRLVVIGETTGIEGLSALQKEISIYPNPSKDVVRISNKAGIRMEEVSIFNLMGQRVYVKEHLDTDKLEVDISALASGIYNVVIGTGLGKVTKKLEVIK